MKTIQVLIQLLAISSVLVLRAQGSFGGDYNGAVVAGANAEWAALTADNPQSGDSVLNSLSKAGDATSGALQPITGNDWVESTLLKGVQKLGGGALGELPIADGSAALGAYCGGDNQTAADTIVKGAMSGVAGWSTGALVTGLLEGTALTVGGFTAPAWVLPVMAGATAAYVTKSAYDYILQPVSSKAAPGPSKPRQPSPTQARPKKPEPRDRDHGGGHDRGGCSDGH